MSDKPLRWFVRLVSIVIIVPVSILVFVFLFLFINGDWLSEEYPRLSAASHLVDRGIIHETVPASATDIRLQYNIDSGETFVIFQLPNADRAAFASQLIPVGRSTATDLAMQTPPGLDDWDEVQMAARLRTGAAIPRRPRDGSRWYFLVPDTGDIYGWLANDVAPSPFTG